MSDMLQQTSCFGAPNDPFCAQWTGHQNADDCEKMGPRRYASVDGHVDVALPWLQKWSSKRSVTKFLCLMGSFYKNTVGKPIMSLPLGDGDFGHCLWHWV